MKKLMVQMMTMLGMGMVSFAAFGDADTLAFYAFKEGEPGDDASTVTFLNSVDPTKFAGSVSKFDKGGSAVTVTDDAPGRFIYSSSLPSAEFICQDPQSVYLSAETVEIGCGGTISLASLATELSRHHSTGYTIEFFFKAEENADPYRAWSQTMILNGGYFTSGTETPFYIYLPCDEIDKARWGFGNYNGSAGARRTFKLHDGKWHHIALVETPPDENGARRIEYRVDGVQYIDITIPADQITVDEYANAVDYKLGLNVLCGKYSCVRATGRALAQDEFLFVGGRAPAAMPSDVVAFYPFDEGTPGDSAVGTTVFNAVQPICNAGAVTLSSGIDGAAVTFDADAPAKYIFRGDAYKSPIVYTDPASLKFTADAAGSGSVTFDALGTEISTRRTNGMTVEYFFKMEDDVYKGYTPSLSFAAGFLHNGGTQAFQLYMPFDANYGSQLRYALNTYNSAYDYPKTAYSTGYNLYDYGWHHVAVVESRQVVAATGDSPETTNTLLSVYVNYEQCGSITIQGTTELTARSALSLCNGCHHGKYSCLCVTDRALEPREFLHASNCETYWPKTAVRWSFDGQIGETIGVVSNEEPSFVSQNPDLYVVQSSGTFAFSGTGTLESGIYSGGLQPRRALVNEGDGEAASRTNASCARVWSNGPGEDGFRYGATANLPLTPGARLQEGDFTVEGFFRYAQSDWQQTAGTYAKTRPRLTLMSHYISSTVIPWRVRLQEANSATHILQVQATATGAQAQSVSTDSGDYFADEKWHHVALSYSENDCRLVLYYDYLPVVTNQLASPLLTVDGGTHFSIGDGPSVVDNVFHGWIDEFRYTRECLEPAEFLRLEGIPVGFLLLFR